MRFETKDFSATVASHIGHFHRDKGDNCQDSYSLISFRAQDQDWIIGVVCDGCGGADIEMDEGTLPGRSEVGSALLASFITRQLRIHIEGDISIHDAVNYLFDAVKRYISSTLWFIKPDEIAYYIQRYWLATIRGVIMNEKEGYIFHAGDGISRIEYKPESGEVFEIEQHDDAPNYIAYACLPKPQQYLPKKYVQDGFDFHRFIVADIQRVMLSSDGFKTHCDRKLIATELTTHAKLPRDLAGEQWNKKGKTGLKRWLNICFDKGYFDDDVVLLLIERKP